MSLPAEMSPHPRAAAPGTAEWLVGGGEMGHLIRSKDWSSTPLGAVESWPQSLRSAVSILLPSRAQICLFWGPDLVAIYNDAYRPALGVKHPWALGLPAREVWSEFWEEVLRPLLEGVLHTGDAFWASDHPFFLERYGYPEETYFDISYDPVRDESGKVGGVFCIVSETTGRVLGERRLGVLRDLGRVASEARGVADAFRQAGAILESDPHDFACAGLFDADKRLMTHCRLSAREGWPLEQARDRELVLQGEDLRGLGPLPGGPWPEPVNTAVILPLATPGQPPLGYLVAGASPRRPFDDAYRDFLRLVASNLAGALAATRALEEQMARAEMLADLDRAKTVFFSNVSHEFRTPLTLMLGPIEDLLQQEQLALPPAARDLLLVAQRNCRRLLKLVNTLLDFSRIEAGRAVAQFEPVDLGRYTAELASNFRSACDKAGVALRIDCPPLPEAVWVDPAMWEKIVLNLISNALKFTFEGEIAISLASAGREVEFQVRDTGVGIAEEEIPRLFERFHRVEGARARTHEGSGIGLALVQELVRLHGGTIRIDSELGRGSTFIVTVPLGNEHLPPERLRQGAPSTPPAVLAASFVEEVLGWLRGGSDSQHVTTSAATTGGESAHILVVDDNADMREYVSRLLLDHWQVTAVCDGQEALDALAADEFDLVITDVMMPRMDGFGLLQAIRSDPSNVDLPVILLSARAGEEAQIEGLGAGASDYVVKPFAAAQLLAQVKAQLNLRRIRRDSAQERERLLERERAAKREAELQRQHLVSLFSQAPNPMVILRGPEYVIELANPPTCRVWGRKEEDVLGRPLFQALPELRGQVFKQLLDGVLATGVPYEGKEVAARLDRRGDGTLDTVYFNFVYTPLRGIEGNIEGVLITAFDVTDEIRARQEMSRLRGDAESASRAKDEFLAMLSHELRNPLAPILSALDLMRLQGKHSHELEVLERQAGHLTRLVDDLLDVSRITRGKIELRRRRMELAESVDKALEQVQPLLETRRHEVDTRGVLRSGLPVDGDPERLAQVVANLLTNAAKYSEPGSRILLAARREGGRVQLVVRDQGMGIAPEMIERIFEPFVQQEQPIERSDGGLGLGLAIVRHLTELHGGEVRVVSGGFGRGSEFTVTLPAATAEETGTIREEGRTPKSFRSTAPRRVLVVDDNYDAAQTLGLLVRHLGHDVEIAHDGPSCLALMPEFRPEVAIVDIGLPGIDGYEVARQLRLQDGGRELLLIAVTGYGLEADRKRSADAGFDHHLVKPVEMKRLIELLP